MTKTEKLTNRCFAAVFGCLGIGALVGVCCGATHQWLIAASCYTMMYVLLAQTKDKQKKQHYGR